MKTTVKTIFAVAAFAVMFNASAQKVGYVKIDSLIQLMPESQKASEEGNAFYKSLETQVMQMQNELKTKYDDYQQKSATMAPLVKATTEKDLTDLQQRIQDFQQNAQGEIQKKNAELSKPILEKANTAIKAVAKENGYRYIFDSSGGYIVYAEPGDDVLPLVLKKLGIDPTKVKPITPAGGGK